MSNAVFIPCFRYAGKVCWCRDSSVHMPIALHLPPATLEQSEKHAVASSLTCSSVESKKRIESRPSTLHKPIAYTARNNNASLPLYKVSDNRRFQYITLASFLAKGVCPSRDTQDGGEYYELYEHHRGPDDEPFFLTSNRRLNTDRTVETCDCREAGDVIIEMRSLMYTDEQVWCSRINCVSRCESSENKRGLNLKLFCQKLTSASAADLQPNVQDWSFPHLFQVAFWTKTSANWPKQSVAEKDQSLSWNSICARGVRHSSFYRHRNAHFLFKHCPRTGRQNQLWRRACRASGSILISFSIKLKMRFRSRGTLRQRYEILWKQNEERACLPLRLVL